VLLHAASSCCYRLFRLVQEFISLREGDVDGVFPPITYHCAFGALAPTSSPSVLLKHGIAMLPSVVPSARKSARSAVLHMVSPCCYLLFRPSQQVLQLHRGRRELDCLFPSFCLSTCFPRRFLHPSFCVLPWYRHAAAIHPSVLPGGNAATCRCLVCFPYPCLVRARPAEP
ncbi:unnamed protein product, partial [Ectocarpus sp. 12 AP-2014]